MALAEEPERPKAVTFIGRLWLVLAVVLMLKALLNLLTWTVLRTTSPTLARSLEEMSPQIAFIGPLLRHAGALLACQAVAWAAVGICAFGLLRLQSWARLAMQVVCWINLTYITLFTVLWFRIWSAAPVAADPSVAGSRRALMLGAVVGVYAIVGAALVAMLVSLRSSRVRAAFPARAPAGA